MKNSSYYLAKNAFVCLIDNHYVFLNLGTDEYLCIGVNDSVAVRHIFGVKNYLQDCDEHIEFYEKEACTADDDDQAIKGLVANGILVSDVRKGKPPSLLNKEIPADNTSLDLTDPRPDIRISHIWHFFAAALTASFNLRWQSIENTVRFIERRKKKKREGSKIVPESSGATTNLFRVFHALRPFYPRPYLCLYDSLALIHFLARYDIYPEWIYGVKLKPFGAHCWVQSDKMVINDIVDNVRDYTPIMSV